jgi:hypothetical protein
MGLPTEALVGVKSIIVGAPPPVVTENPFAREATSKPVVIVTGRGPIMAPDEIAIPALACVESVTVVEFTLTPGP